MMQIINTINEILDLNTKPENIQRVIMEYYEQLYKHKFNSLKEMKQFLKKPQLPQLEIDNLNTLYLSKTLKS